MWHTAIQADTLVAGVSIDVAENVVYIFTGGATSGSLIALHSADGSQLWHEDGNPLSELESSSIQIANGNVYYTDANTGVAYALNGNDGSTRWHYAVGTPDTGQTDPFVLGQ